MRTYGWSLLVVVVVIAGLLATPATREVIRVEGSAFCPFAPLRGLYLLGDSAAERPAGLEVDQLAARARAGNPKDWKIVMGAGLLAQDEKKKLDYLEEAAQLAPDEPAAFIALAESRMEGLEWQRETMFRYAQKEVPPDFKEEFLTAEDARPVAEILERLKRIDPDNAAPEALLCWLDFGQKRDTEALAHLKAAAAKPKWDLYERTLSQLEMQVLTDLGIPEFEATSYSYLTLLPEFRTTAAVARQKGVEAKEAGRHQEAVEDWMAVISLGRLVRYEGDTFLESLLAIDIEEIGARPIYMRMWMEPATERGLTPVSELAGKEGRYNSGDIFAGRHLDYFIEHAGAAAAADVLAGLEQAQEFKLEMRKYSDKAYEKEHHIDRRAIGTLIAGTVILGQILLLFVLTILLWIVVRDRAQSTPRLRRFWVITLALIPLTLTLPYWLIYLVCMKDLCDERSVWLTFLSKKLMQMQFHPSIVLASLPVILLLCTLLAGVWMKRKSAGRHSWRAIFAGILRQVVPVCLVLVALCYGLNTIQTARLRAKSVSIFNRYITGEMAEFRSQHPQFFTAPSPVEPK